MASRQARLSNPAGRLFAVLSAANAKKDDMPTLKVWLDVLAAGNDESLVIERLAILRRQYELLRLRIESEDGLNTELYAQQLASVPVIIHPAHLPGAWSGVRHRLTDGVLLSLSFCSDWLESRTVEREIAADDLSQLQKEVEETIEFVIASNADYAFRATLLKCLEHIRAAIVDYRFRGADVLEEALEQFTGAVVLHHMEVKSSDSAEAEAEISKLEKLMLRVHALVSFAKDARELLEPAIRALLT